MEGSVTLYDMLEKSAELPAFYFKSISIDYLQQKISEWLEEEGKDAEN